MHVKRCSNFVSEMNYMCLILLFVVYFCHLVVRRHSREKSQRAGFRVVLSLLLHLLSEGDISITPVGGMSILKTYKLINFQKVKPTKHFSVRFFFHWNNSCVGVLFMLFFSTFHLRLLKTSCQKIGICCQILPRNNQDISSESGGKG